MTTTVLSLGVNALRSLRISTSLSFPRYILLVCSFMFFLLKILYLRNYEMNTVFTNIYTMYNKRYHRCIIWPPSAGTKCAASWVRPDGGSSRATLIVLLNIIHTKQSNNRSKEKKILYRVCVCVNEYIVCLHVCMYVHKEEKGKHGHEAQPINQPSCSGLQPSIRTPKSYEELAPTNNFNQSPRHVRSAPQPSPIRN